MIFWGWMMEEEKRKTKVVGQFMLAQVGQF